MRSHSTDETKPSLEIQTPFEEEIPPEELAKLEEQLALFDMTHHSFRISANEAIRSFPYKSTYCTFSGGNLLGPDPGAYIKISNSLRPHRT